MADEDVVRLTRTMVPAELPLMSCNLSAMPDVLRQAREAVDELRISHPESTPSNVNSVYMSPWKSHTLNDKLLPLCNTVRNLARVAALGMTGSDLKDFNLELMVADCWGAIYEEADFTARHNHFPADFAAVVYLEAAPNCAPLVLSGHTPIQPEPGTLLMFPGVMDHEVPATAGRRVVVAMNLYKRAAA